ncbi:hypothetical protein [Ruficoccus sp. ZRK36]|uniref:hypothetical protein n=1 Tax=Ruficoccus sp. ZRK36 TaxID=2866311 RepID=UPI001C739147|nr:hypothetical protein [Ruficoccus sp. ZRK36]QYY37180.1 hypothetical protein K0V07_06770 [Ruficoccus sp. ZRK36]
MPSATEEKIIRSLDFKTDQREAALRQAQFHCELLDDYIRQEFTVKPGYTVEHESSSPGNHTYAIRKGSGELTVETNFGLNTTYGPGGPRNFYTLNLEASHRNTALDNTAEVNDVLVWCLRCGVGVLFAVPMLVVTTRFNHPATAKAMMVIVAGAVALGGATGSYVGTLIGRGIFAIRQKQLNHAGQLDSMQDEWSFLSSIIEDIMIENEGFAYNHYNGGNAYD